MREVLRFLRGNRLASYGAGLLVVILLALIFGPMLSPYEPARLNVVDALAGPSATHWLGTDSFGRDVLTRLLHGGRVTLGIGIAVIAIAFTVGVTYGTISGFAGGWVDIAMMRVVDAVLSFPALVLAIALAAAFGASLENAMLAVAITLAPQFARVARAQAVSISVRPFVEAAIALGLPNRRILWRYILPNGLAPLLVQSTLALGSAVLQTASLGFLGLGAQPPIAEWGTDVANNLQYARGSPWVALAPGTSILLTVLCFNMIGDGLADWMNPRRKNSG